MQLLERLLRLLALVAGAILLFLTGFIVVDVVLRYVFNAPFSSSKEVTEFAMSLIVFLAIAYCGWTGGHIAVDLFERWLDRPALRFLPAMISFVGAALFAVIAWRTAVEAIEMLPQASNTLRMPHYPFRLTVAFGSAMFALVLAIQGIGVLHRPQTDACRSS
jgi:TRAP-type C4-dicarboxylate transport system permease small subunit